ncbi:hypothetical protein LY56_02712 [Roseinatronobacter thiooxidans]|uniref:Uncharacterized protein n=1 Tax=Roseinatronobacter thiooxidans TaxID=121821 RepID=A0A2W7PT90_9RHOB|nr:hypothetical protein [Roseinatronobacter thiooxidans]PZX39544.1 hypothetical protein LY56_02712 [Roseinatronobacter thiooxidans]
MPFFNIPLNGVPRACLAATLFVAVTQGGGYTAQAGQVSVIPPTSVVVPPIPAPTPPAPVAPALTPTTPVFAPSGQPGTQTVGLPPSTVQNVLSANISVLSPDQTREALGLIATILDNPAGLSRNQRQSLRQQRSALERQLSD